MSTVTFTKLCRMREDLPHDEAVIVLASGIKPGQILWKECVRRSLLGGYIATIRETYTHWGGISPNRILAENMPTRYFEEVWP